MLRERGRRDERGSGIGCRVWRVEDGGVERPDGSCERRACDGKSGKDDRSTHDGWLVTVSVSVRLRATSGHINLHGREVRARREVREGCELVRECSVRAECYE